MPEDDGTMLEGGLRLGAQVSDDDCDSECAFHSYPSPVTHDTSVGDPGDKAAVCPSSASAPLSHHIS